MTDSADRRAIADALTVQAANARALAEQTRRNIESARAAAEAAENARRLREGTSR